MQLIERVVREHPYQTLTVVLALCNAEKDTTAEAKVPMPPRAKKPRAAAVPAEVRPAEPLKPLHWNLEIMLVLGLNLYP